MPWVNFGARISAGKAVGKGVPSPVRHGIDRTRCPTRGVRMANLQRTDLDGVTVLRLRGTLDRTELAAGEQTFRAATHRDHASIVIDLADVNFLTTPAIAMFLDAAKTLRHS